MKRGLAPRCSAGIPGSGGAKTEEWGVRTGLALVPSNQLSNLALGDLNLTWMVLAAKNLRKIWGGWSGDPGGGHRQLALLFLFPKNLSCQNFLGKIGHAEKILGKKEEEE